MENTIVQFTDDNLTLDVNISPDEDTVWLSQSQMAELFKTTPQNIILHIKNLYHEKELSSESTCKDFLQVRQEGSRTVKRKQKFYNLDVIISVGYRVKSPRGIIFRKWATNVLRQYLKEGYAVNEKRLAVLNRTIEIQTNIIAGITGIDSADVLKVIQEYSRSLELLDAYDHQRVPIPQGNKCLYHITYPECMQIIKNMEFSRTSDIFGIEKEPGKLEGILAAIYQTAFGKDVYDTLEAKAAHLLYFLVKDHPFNDGCKRIAAALFLYFLNQNNVLYNNNNKVISDSALVAITLMIAESRPEEKDIMISVIMNFLQWK